ncbi:MAG: ATP cone domain-containing protein [Cellulophaga sp.]|nr:ATP cone domain-containing protein [Cellulophaga sp.]
MENTSIEIIKSTGEKAKFSFEKLRASLNKTKADKATIDNIINVVRDELYQGISTKEVYNRAFALLKKKGKSFSWNVYILKLNEIEKIRL